MIKTSQESSNFLQELLLNWDCEPSSRIATEGGKVFMERHCRKAARWTLQQFGSINNALLYQSFACCISMSFLVFSHTWSGLAASCDLTVATFVCDSATANQLMVTLVGQSSPANALVAGQEGLAAVVFKRLVSRYLHCAGKMCMCQCVPDVLRLADSLVWCLGFG